MWKWLGSAIKCKGAQNQPYANKVVNLSQKSWSDQAQPQRCKSDPSNMITQVINLNPYHVESIDT